MKKFIYCLTALAALFISCSKDKDMFDPAAAQAEQLQNAEEKLGVTIDADHTWIQTTNRTVTFTNMPSDIKVKYLLVMDSNPLKDNTAEVLSMTEGNQKSISFEAPSDLSTLYAVCVDETGDVRVRAFDAAKGSVSFAPVADFQLIPATSASARVKALRAAESNTLSSLEWNTTVHAKMFADKGWNDQWAYIERGETDVHFDDITKYIDIVLGFLPEGGLNFRDTLNKAEMVRNNYYAVVGEGGGEVTLTAIYRNTANPDSRFGYYYFVPGQERNIKTVRKFVFKDALPKNYHNTDRSNIPSDQTVPAYKLVYYDEDGNPSYTFPEGTEIGFFNNVNPRYIGSMDEAFNWYNQGDANAELSGYFKSQNVLPNWAKSYNVGWETFSHTVMFKRDGYQFVCFEDWVQDFDMNDIVLMIDGNINDQPVAPAKACKDDIRFYRFSYSYEDTRMGDYDMNDAVLRVWRQAFNRQSLQVELAACGASDEIYLFYNRIDGTKVALFDGKEAHQLFIEAGNTESHFYNTEGINAPNLPIMTLPMTNSEFNDFNYSRADFFIYNATKDIEVHLPSAIGARGSAPYAICTPQKAWKWPKEYISITKAYNPYFGPYAANQDVNADWYNFPVDDLVLYYDTAR